MDLETGILSEVRHKKINSVRYRLYVESNKGVHINLFTEKK